MERSGSIQPAAAYENFRSALYVRAIDTAPLAGDISGFVAQFERIAAHVRIGKVYLETHRDLKMPDEATLTALKAYFAERGIPTSAGITVTIDETNDFRTFCYNDPFCRNKLVEIVEYSARHFDEIVFDDFFFTNCKCPRCIESKGARSWTEFRLELMTRASRDLVLAPARAVNPNVEVVIKYPNWYDHFQGLGFNLKDQPPLYEGIYTGNETRDAAHGAQHLQPYESYQVFRNYENIKPGGNRGGWVDPFGSPTLERYAEQLWLTLFAKAPELTLFDFFSIQMPIRETQRASWQNAGARFSFDKVTAKLRGHFGSLREEAIMAAAAGAALDAVDPILPELGNPIGIKVYKPYHSMGEDFLVNYLGMLGLPIDMEPAFPADAKTVLLTENAAADPQIVERIRKQLLDGKKVVITSGLLGALQDRGLSEIVEARRSDRKMTLHTFQMGWMPTQHVPEKPFQVPVLELLTNDAWELVSGNSGDAGAPLFTAVTYGPGKLYILTVPDNFDDLYRLPHTVLACIADVVAQDLYVHLDAPAKVSLFVYDNDTFIVHNFRDAAADVSLVLDKRVTAVRELFPDGGPLPAVPVPGAKDGRGTVEITVKPHAFRVFRCMA